MSAATSHGAVLAFNGAESSTIGVHQVCQALVLHGFPLLLSLLHVMKLSVSRSYEKTRLRVSLGDGEFSV